MTVLALSAEGSLLAQSAPARAGSATAPTLASIEHESPSVGPELEAARASLGGTTKRSDTGAPVDLNSLANRPPPGGRPVANGLVLPRGTGAPIQANAGGWDGLQTLQGDATGAASTTAGAATRIVPVGGPTPGGASSNVPALHAETVIRGQINPAAKICYESDADSKSKRPGRLAIVIKLTPAGEVDSVSVSSVGLSPAVASCITTAARAAKFAAPGANGATVRAAFTFPAPDEQAPPPAVSGKGAHVANAPGSAARVTVAEAAPQPANAETVHR